MSAVCLPYGRTVILLQINTLACRPYPRQPTRSHVEIFVPCSSKTGGTIRLHIQSFSHLSTSQKFHHHGSPTAQCRESSYQVRKDFSELSHRGGKERPRPQSQHVDLLQAGYYITNLPPSGALKPAQLAVLRKISDHFFQESHGSQRDARSVSHVDQAQSMDFDEGSLMEDQEILDNPEASSPARQTKSVTGDNQTPVGGSAAERGTNISSPLNSAPKRRGRPKKTEGTTTNTSNQLWGTVLAKTEFNLEISLREHLESNNAFDATRCLKSTPPSLETPLEEHWERFLKFCEDITELPTSTPRESVDRLFLLLAVGDIALHTCGPKWSSKGGNPQKEKILAQLGNNRYKNLQEIFKMADRLMFICECREFGIGCIFWLYGEFNNNL